MTWDPTCDGYRLPTEAEWEYAARAGTTTAFSFGDVGSEAEDLKHIARYAWFWVGSFTKAKPVRTRLANPWNLFDMHGNVWEWVWDLYAKDYGVDLAALTIDPRGPPGASGERVARGGSFGLAESNLRSAQRIWFPPAYRIKNYGFRCARGAARARN